MTTFDYPEKFCAYIDILGFRNIVADLGSGGSSGAKLVALIYALQRVHKPLKPGISDLSDVDYRTQSISDAVAISVSPTLKGLLGLTDVLQVLTLGLLSEGYFIRGAITRGALHHDDGVVFGEALIKAYDLESQIVRYPRIMVMSDVAAVANGTDALAAACRNRLRAADDGPLFLHVLQEMQREMNASPLGPDNDEGDKFGGFATIKAVIEKRYQEAIDNPRHYEKVQWFARYWNSCLPANASTFRVLSPGL